MAAILLIGAQGRREDRLPQQSDNHKRHYLCNYINVKAMIDLKHELSNDCYLTSVIVNRGYL